MEEDFLTPPFGGMWWLTKFGRSCHQGGLHISCYCGELQEVNASHATSSVIEAPDPFSLEAIGS
jgi:hypothetical protein